ncbi:uncharacterized protein FOMMEDRAFT_156108 [Fomitiporia mediterranea MF3/22]|uniref:uncharacterized protein n=1 Tax=Fomitiporia mediterranea (strain MF3/22) TaxID=694068 RepID=UPI0004408A19|nr:uncharacterized protein FOMMEDRAFT_156108 [Fomitiporia mediterranea MF3/22]EJD02768.1 hypothetical protein FOMMEDRAFT_156108 [Fomitiporia mediterranea MF3/22]
MLGEVRSASLQILVRVNAWSMICPCPVGAERSNRYIAASGVVLFPSIELNGPVAYSSGSETETKVRLCHVAAGVTGSESRKKNSDGDHTASLLVPVPLNYDSTAHPAPLLFIIHRIPLSAFGRGDVRSPQSSFKRNAIVARSLALKPDVHLNQSHAIARSSTLPGAAAH